jgi:hypothetical protein
MAGRYSIFDDTVLPFPFYLLHRDSFHTDRVPAEEVTSYKRKKSVRKLVAVVPTVR